MTDEAYRFDIGAADYRVSEQEDRR